jgi:hypothetical protein
VHQQRIGARGGQSALGQRRNQPEARRAVDRVAQRRADQLPAAVLEVLPARDRMADVVPQRRQRFARAAHAGPVAGPARHRRQQRALDLLLQVDHRRVALAAQVGAEGRELAPRGRGEQLSAPAADATGIVRRTPGCRPTSGTKFSATQSSASSGGSPSVGDHGQRVHDVTSDEAGSPGSRSSARRAGRSPGGGRGPGKPVECALFNRARSLGSREVRAHVRTAPH